jgi:hypothetical protein
MTRFAQKNCILLHAGNSSTEDWGKVIFLFLVCWNESWLHPILKTL